MYQSGSQAFVPDEGVEGAEVFVLGQNPGADEAREGRPYVGQTGQSLTTRYFAEAGLERGVNVSLGNALRCRWRGGNDLPANPTLDKALAHCQGAHFRLPSTTRLIVAQGGVAWKALGQTGTIGNWRGFLGREYAQRLEDTC